MEKSAAPSVDDLDTFLKKFTLFPTLAKIGKKSIDIFNKNSAVEKLQVKRGIQTFKHYITQWGLAFISYRLIMVSNDGRREEFKGDDLIDATSCYNNLYEPFLDDDDLIGFLCRMAQEQFWWQGTVKFEFARHHLMFSMPQMSKFCRIFEESFGITIREFIMIGVVALARIAQSGPVFKKDGLLNHKIERLKDILIETKIDRFSNIAVASNDRARDLARDINKATLLEYKKYEFNPLFKFPIIEGDTRFPHSRNLFVVPNKMLLLKRVTEGVYWDLRDLYKDKSEEFLIAFGEVFEEYVGLLLKRYFKKEEILRLQSQEGKRLKISDWMVCQDDTILILECKSSLMPLQVRESFSSNVFEDWLEKVIVEGCEQLFSTETLLRNDKLAVQYDAQRVYKVLVLYENLQLGESFFLKDKFKDLLEKKGIHTMYPQAENIFYIMHVQELELLESVIKKCSLRKIFDMKTDMETEKNIRKRIDFSSVYEKIMQTGKVDSEFLTSTYRKYFDL